ncbi:MAG TPA: peptidoglycan DD-metalloendopeptidase family protein [Micropepsaceae bacterium]|jgi:murein DD-endopeptidase MepM/ murein hydrolase activator NlpD
MDLLRQRAWRRISHTFPERQIYIRSDGRVQFLTFSSQMQAILACICVMFLSWVAFTSVNVLFKDRILVAKERHFQQMQASYESRIADLQLSYDELNSSLVVAQDRFQAIADSFEAKQQTLAAIIEHKKELQASLGIGTPLSKAAALDVKPTQSPSIASGVGGVFDPGRPNLSVIAPPPSILDAGLQQNSIASKPIDRSATAIVSHAPERATFFRGAVLKLGALFHRKISANDSNHPVIKQADAQSARIVRLGLGESTLLAEATQDVNKEVSRLSRALSITGINTKTLTSRVSAAGGGTESPIPFELSTDVTDDAFGAGIADAATAMGKLHDVVNALSAVPLIAPTELGSVSSSFGARVDPFNEQLAFHSGIDFSGPKGSDVHATAPGIVVFAGPKGDYGNTVEVDHGYGIRTRYGHLSKILAQVGNPVDRGAVVGRLGSTGRSTGPHVHYEVWYDDAVRDPGRFIKAGRDVLKE